MTTESEIINKAFEAHLEETAFNGELEEVGEKETTANQVE